MHAQARDMFAHLHTVRTLQAMHCRSDGKRHAEKPLHSEFDCFSARSKPFSAVLPAQGSAACVEGDLLRDLHVLIDPDLLRPRLCGCQSSLVQPGNDVACTVDSLF